MPVVFDNVEAEIDEQGMAEQIDSAEENEGDAQQEIDKHDFNKLLRYCERRRQRVFAD